MLGKCHVKTMQVLTDGITISSFYMLHSAQMNPSTHTDTVDTRLPFLSSSPPQPTCIHLCVCVCVCVRAANLFIYLYTPSASVPAGPLKGSICKKWTLWFRPRGVCVCSFCASLFRINTQLVYSALIIPPPPFSYSTLLLFPFSLPFPTFFP